MRWMCGLKVGLMFKNGSCQQAGVALCGVRPRHSSPYIAKVFTLSRSLEFFRLQQALPSDRTQGADDSRDRLCHVER